MALPPLATAQLVLLKVAQPPMMPEALLASEVTMLPTLPKFSVPPTSVLRSPRFRVLVATEVEAVDAPDLIWVVLKFCVVVPVRV